MNSLKMNFKLLNKILWCSIFLCSSLAIFAQNHDQLFDEANAAYQKRNYEHAATLYQKIADAGNEGVILYYNLGNAYFKCDQPAKALLWYERARRLDPNNADIQHNIAFVNQKLTDNIETLPQFFITRWWNALSGSLTAHAWAICSIIVSLLFFLSIAGILLAKPAWLRTTSTWCSLLCVIVLVLSIIFANKEKNKYAQVPEAIVMASVLNVKSTPDDNSKALFVIHEGLKVQVTDTLNAWVEIELPNGDKGWVPASSIEII